MHTAKGKDLSEPFIAEEMKDLSDPVITEEIIARHRLWKQRKKLAMHYLGDAWQMTTACIGSCFNGIAGFARSGWPGFAFTVCVLMMIACVYTYAQSVQKNPLVETFQIDDVVIVQMEYISAKNGDETLTRLVTEYEMTQIPPESVVKLLQKRGYDVHLDSMLTVYRAGEVRNGTVQGNANYHPVNTSGEFSVRGDVLFNRLRISPNGQVQIEWDEGQDAASRSHGLYLAKEIAHAVVYGQ